MAYKIEILTIQQNNEYKVFSDEDPLLPHYEMVMLIADSLHSWGAPIGVSQFTISLFHSVYISDSSLRLTR